MCIGDKVIRYYNKPGRYRKQDPKWNGASHSTHPVYYRYYRKLVNCIDNYRCRKFGGKFEC